MFVYDLSTPKADFGLLYVLLLIVLPLPVVSTWIGWKHYQASKRIDEAAKAATALAGAVDSTPSPGDGDDRPAAWAAIARQPPAAADPVEGAVRMRCPECGTDSTEAPQVCARCGAPLSSPHLSLAVSPTKAKERCLATVARCQMTGVQPSSLGARQCRASLDP